MSRFNDWYVSIVGHQFDGDGDGSFDCVDVAESWCSYLWPQSNWSIELGFGNAKDLYAAASSNYFDKIPYSMGFVPQQGDIIVYGATPTNPYGHIAAVVSATASNVTVVQENSYTQQAAYVGTLGYSYCIGVLRPKINLQGDNMVTDSNHLNALFRRFRGREASQDEINRYVGKVEYDPLIESLDTGPEADATAKALAAGETALKDDWPGQIASLQSQLKVSQTVPSLPPPETPTPPATPPPVVPPPIPPTPQKPPAKPPSAGGMGLLDQILNFLRRKP